MAAADDDAAAAEAVTDADAAATDGIAREASGRDNDVVAPTGDDVQQRSVGTAARTAAVRR